MEGPSIRLLSERTQNFRGRTIQNVRGNSKQVDFDSLIGKTVTDIFYRGKNYFIELDEHALKFHFLMYGSFAIDSERSRTPRLLLEFNEGKFAVYSCSVQILEINEARNFLDEELDITSDIWNKERLMSLLYNTEGEASDILLEQELFPGLGNIIKNEALYRAGIHPEARIEDLNRKMLSRLADEARSFTEFWLETWRKGNRIRDEYKIYKKIKCPLSHEVTRAKTGRKNRLSFWCNVEQKF